MARESKIQRNTSETQVEVKLCLEGTGKSQISTGISFLDHMLEQLARHGWFDLEVCARGDLKVDFHHTVEDVGICLGKAIKEALGGGAGIRRFAHVQVPMDESLVGVSMDLSGRPYLVCRLPRRMERAGDFSVGLLEEFFRALSVHGGITLHIDFLRGKDPHHLMEATFKAFGRALAEAVALEPRSQGVPSTKGVVD
ncbi:MAG: imidazoleglycerol-phosphate dehydratase HisB [bacterium]